MTTAMKTIASAPNFNYGYPSPGPQHPTGTDVMNHVFFLSPGDWERVREEEQFDYIVIGSGPCALGFTDRVLRSNPKARILIIERGPFFLPEHFQNLPLPYQHVMGGLSETFPWTLSTRTINNRLPIKWQHGMVPFFGGRSTVWSAWCPRPTPDEMIGWPQEAIEAIQDHFESAEKLLNVVPADKIENGRSSIFGTLQNELKKLLDKNLKKIDSATRVIHAPLAMSDPDLGHEKFATPGALLSLVVEQREKAQKQDGAPLQIVTECVVTRILQQEGMATALETTRGVVNVADAKVILAMGSLPPTTLVLNSFPQVQNAGQRFTAHFISSIVARVRRADFDFGSKLNELELAAIYLAGKNPSTRKQYHIQLTALSDKNAASNAGKAGRYMPDVVATATTEQLLTSEDYVVFVCATLGELDYNNPDSWFKKNDGTDPTTNVILQVLENKNDLALWNTMDEAAFQALELVLSPKGENNVEYWHNSSSQWLHSRPPTEQIRVPGLVHEGSTMHIGGDEDAVVGLDYRPKGVRNVYVTGGALWPTSGSWNPTMAMVGLAQDLADKLEKRKKRKASEAMR